MIDLINVVFNEPQIYRMNYWLLQLVTKLPCLNSLSLNFKTSVTLIHIHNKKSLFIYTYMVEWSDISDNHMLGNQMVAQSIKSMEKGCTSLALHFFILQICLHFVTEDVRIEKISMLI